MSDCCASYLAAIASDHMGCFLHFEETQDFDGSRALIEAASMNKLSTVQHLLELVYAMNDFITVDPAKKGLVNMLKFLFSKQFSTSHHRLETYAADNQ